MGGGLVCYEKYQPINLTGPVHEAEIDFLKGHVMVTFVVAIESDQEAFNAVLELVNNVGTKERGTKRGNVVGLGSYDRAVCLGGEFIVSLYYHRPAREEIL